MTNYVYNKYEALSSYKEEYLETISNPFTSGSIFYYLRNTKQKVGKFNKNTGLYDYIGESIFPSENTAFLYPMPANSNRSTPLAIRYALVKGSSSTTPIETIRKYQGTRTYTKGPFLREATFSEELDLDENGYRTDGYIYELIKIYGFDISYNGHKIADAIYKDENGKLWSIGLKNTILKTI